MTNNEGQMTKEVPMTNDEKTLARCRISSSFELRHSFVILSRFVLILVVAVAVSCSSKRIAKANVDQVAEGMSKKQVESILGPPTSRTTDVYIYRQSKDTVTIVFKDDKVQSKDSTLRD